MLNSEKDNKIINSISQETNIKSDNSKLTIISKNDQKENIENKYLYEKNEKDIVKDNLRELLNIISKDNFNIIKEKILEIIKKNLDYQKIFIDLLFQKAIMDTFFAKVYSKLCKLLDKILPQKCPSKLNEKSKKPTSMMRVYLLDKIKKYIKEKELEELYDKEKSYYLGNIYFICELITFKIISKKIFIKIINSFFDKYKTKQNNIYLQAIIIFTDKFGTLIYSIKQKLNENDFKEYNNCLDEIIKKLENIQKENNFSGKIKYLLINLIEKRKNNFTKYLYEENMYAKSKSDIEKELKNYQTKQDQINEKILKELKDYKEYINKYNNTYDFQWEESTELYNIQENGLDDILEGYIISCVDFIEYKNDVDYAKKYIKEFIEYYSKTIDIDEKNNIKNRLLKIFEFLNYLSLDNPFIINIYSYVIFICLKNDIIKKEIFENIYNDKNTLDEDRKILNFILENIKDLYN